MKKELFISTQIGRNCIQLRFHNGKFLGEIFQQEDHEWVFFPVELNGGYWNSGVLKQLAAKLDDLNNVN